MGDEKCEKNLPIHEEVRDRMLMEKVKGVIPCPICKKGKVIAYESASGKSSVGCHNCGRYLLVDWDKMTAIENKACKDAYKMVVNN